MSIKELDQKYVANTYARFPIELVSGKGSKLYDSDGKEYIDNASYIIKIDHHPLSDDFGDVSIIDEHAAAAAELLADILFSFKMKVSQKCAYYLYSAIVGDSGRFQYSDTNPRTFKVVSKLFESKFIEKHINSIQE